MNSCRICGRPLRNPAKFCKEPCSGEFTCMCCGKMKESGEFPDYRDEGGAFKSTCKRCWNEKMKAKYEPRPKYIELTCHICGGSFVGRAGSKYCNDECREEGRRIVDRNYYYRRKRCVR